MKMRTLKLSPKFLVEAIQGKAATFAANLPEDVQLLDLKFDLCSNQVFAVIRSDSFDDVAELYPIPEFKLAYTVSPKITSRAAPSAKAEPKPSPIVNPEILSQPNRTTGRIENEFSPEQRKLLSFKVEGDTVILKPTKFLKAEWEDINEVVKSLGGKWVKGDIVSYWEIPLQ